MIHMTMRTTITAPMKIATPPMPVFSCDMSLLFSWEWTGRSGGQGPAMRRSSGSTSRSYTLKNSGDVGPIWEMYSSS
jgi:hypothetical protein